MLSDLTGINMYNFNKRVNKSSATFDKLALKILKDCNLDCDRFARTYAGYYMRCSGAYVWRAYIKCSSFEIGGCESATKMLKYKELECVKSFSIGSNEIIEKE